MSNPTRNALPVKPTTPARTFGEGILEPTPTRSPRRRPKFTPTPADLAWAAATSPTRDLDYDVLIAAPGPICGGAPDWDELADEATAMDLLERGLDASGPSRRPGVPRGPMARPASNGLTGLDDADVLLMTGSVG